MWDGLDVGAVVEQLSSLVVTWGARVIGALLVLAVGWLASRAAGRWVESALEKTNVDSGVASFASSAARLLSVGLALLLCLGVFGVETTSIAALLGGAGVAIGIALKGNLSNLATGLVVLFVRPFKVGDRIEVDGYYGVVTAVQIMTTRIRTLDNREVVVPNQKLLDDALVNDDAYPTRRADIDVGVAYDTDLRQADRVLMEAAKSVPGQVGDEPLVRVESFGASSIDYKVGIWVSNTDVRDGRARLIHAVHRALGEAGIEIPYPQRDLHLRSGLPRIIAPAAD